MRFRFAQLNLCAHLFQASSKRVNSALLFCDDSFQVLHLMALFKELIEQHRVHLIVTYAVGFSFFVAHNQIRIYFGGDPVRFSEPKTPGVQVLAERAAPFSDAQKIEAPISSV